MAITEKDYLHIQYGNRIYILLRSSTHFHMVQINAALTEEAMTRLMQMYPCSTKEIEALGLHVSAFKADTLTEVHFEGTVTGSSMELRRNGAPLRCTLETSYSEKFLKRFFVGYPVSVIQPPKPEISKQTIGKINLTLHIISALSTALHIFFHSFSILWSIPALLCQLPPLFLLLFAPNYFHLADEKENKYDPSLRNGSLFWTIFMPTAALLWTSLSCFTYEDSVYPRLLLIHVSLNLLLFILLPFLFKTSRVWFRQNLYLLIIMLFISFGNTQYVNYFVSPIPTDHFTASIIELQVTRYSRSTSYEAIVKFPDGSRQALNLQKTDYHSLSPEDKIYVSYHEGIFDFCPFYKYEISKE